MTTYIGKLSKNDCTISDSAANQSVLVTGISGSGKTCRVHQMELKTVYNGQTVIVFDVGNSHNPKQIFQPIRSEYEALSNRIPVIQAGIDPHFFSSDCSPQLQSTPEFLIINNIAQAISKPANLGVNQTKVLRNAISNAFHKYTAEDNEMQLIGSALKELGTVGENLYQRLWPLFECNVFRPSTHNIQPNKINILDFSNLDSETQQILIEILLAGLWRHRDTFQNKNTKCNLFLDECQLLYLGSTSIVCQLLREGRKFGINLILATQSLSNIPRQAISMLQQAGTKLYFQPAQADLRHIAKSLSQIYGGDWQQPLAQLRRGECIADGILQVGESTIRRPLILT